MLEYALVFYEGENMREFSLLDVIKYYLKKFWIVGVVVLFTFFVGYFYTNEYFKPMYEESATIILGKSNDSKTDSEFSYSTITLYDSLIKNYLELLESNKLFFDVKENLKLDYSVTDISKMVEYSVADTSQMMTITVKNSSDEMAVDICNEIIDVLKDYVYDVYGFDNITVVDKAVVTGNLSIEKNMIIICFIFIGIVLSSLIIVLKYIFSNKLSENDSEATKNNLNVLGKVRQIIDKKDYTLNSMISSKEINGFRNIRANLLKKINDNKVIMISSINKCKNKSYVTYNLALAFKNIDKRVLVIDANEKDGLITQTFLDKKSGLLNVMDEKMSVLEVINSINNMDFIALGNKKMIDLISSNHFEELLAQVKDKYDYIFIESPCFKNNFEPYSIMKLVDGIIMISDSNSNVNDLEVILNEIKDSKSIFLGTIFVRSRKRIFKIFSEKQKTKFANRQKKKTTVKINEKKSKTKRIRLFEILKMKNKNSNSNNKSKKEDKKLSVKKDVKGVKKNSKSFIKTKTKDDSAKTKTKSTVKQETTKKVPSKKAATKSTNSRSKKV